MSLYIKQEHVQALGKSVGIALLSPHKYIKGTVFTAHTACLSMSPVHQCEHGKGKGAEHMLMLLSPCSVDQVMGLEGCVGVHSTSRPPPKRFIFPAVAIDCGLEVCRHVLAYLFFYVYVALLVEG